MKLTPRGKKLHFGIKLLARGGLVTGICTVASMLVLQLDNRVISGQGPSAGSMFTAIVGLLLVLLALKVVITTIDQHNPVTYCLNYMRVRRALRTATPTS